MTESEFWKWIESTQSKDPDAQAKQLIDQLAERPVPEILSFGHHWSVAHNAAYDWNLWGAAYTINGGCSDDGFTDFRSWLILQGERVYRAALADPDSLADTDVRSDEANCECYIASQAYERATESQNASDYYDALTASHGTHHQTPDPSGDQWDFDDQKEVAKRLPKLHARFGYS